MSTAEAGVSKSTLGSLNSEIKLRASLMRAATRGSHCREDYPGRNFEFCMRLG